MGDWSATDRGLVADLAGTCQRPNHRSQVFEPVQEVAKRLQRMCDRGLKCLHHFKPDWINNMDHLRISDTESSSVILCQTKLFEKVEEWCPKRALTCWGQKGWCQSPKKLQFQSIFNIENVEIVRLIDRGSRSLGFSLRTKMQDDEWTTVGKLKKKKTKRS